MALWRVNKVEPENRAAVIRAWYDRESVEVASIGDYCKPPQWDPVYVDPSNWDWNRDTYRIARLSRISKFWMVYNPSHGAPRVQQPTYEKAKAEAERLASLHPDQTFYILESVATTKAVKMPVETIKL